MLSDDDIFKFIEIEGFELEKNLIIDEISSDFIVKGYRMKETELILIYLPDDNSINFDIQINSGEKLKPYEYDFIDVLCNKLKKDNLLIKTSSITKIDIPNTCTQDNPLNIYKTAKTGAGHV